MKTGKLIKEGKNWKISSPDFKQPMSISGDYGLTDNMENQEVKFDNSGGSLKMIVLNNKTYTKINVTQAAQINSYSQNNFHINRNNLFQPLPVNEGIQQNFAKAPYNFVPINEKVVVSPLNVEEILFNSYKSGPDYLTGKISLEIEAMTPIYIRGMKSIISKESGNSAEFFKGKDYCIPGSSLRGLLRTMTEIVSYSKMGSINNDTLTKRFHYRAFADQSLTLREKYASKMIKRENNPECYSPKVKAGILKKEGKNYIVCEGKHYKVEEDNAYVQKVINQLMSIQIGENYRANNSYSPGFKKIWFRADTEMIHPNHSKTLKYAKVTDISNDRAASLKEGYLVCSGWMIGPRIRPRGKHMHWVIGDINYKSRIEVPEDVIANYTNDIARNGMDLISKLKTAEINEVPCFYITDDNNKIISFGHTGMFRLAYEKPLIEFFPKDHRQYDKNDFTEILFGKNEVIPSRVFVEDAFIKSGQISEQIKIPSIMGTPKPTTFQHYLKQDASQIRPEYNRQGRVSGYWGLRDYNQNTLVNGNKLYWHIGDIDYPINIEIKTKTFKEFLQKNNLNNIFFNFQFDRDRTVFNFPTLTLKQYEAIIQFSLTQKESQHTAIRPFLRNARFEGCIRFENLTRVELGALLFTLCLPDNYYLKIGMGKALGFGSIKLKSKVYISDRILRYKDLLSEWRCVDEPNIDLPQSEINSFTKSFEKYVLSKIGSSSTSLWQEERLIELRTMLDFKNQIIGEKSKYMVIGNNRENEYKSRPILQSPTDYINKN